MKKYRKIVNKNFLDIQSLQEYFYEKESIIIGGFEYKLPSNKPSAGDILRVAADGKSLEWTEKDELIISYKLKSGGTTIQIESSVPFRLIDDDGSKSYEASGGLQTCNVVGENVDAYAFLGKTTDVFSVHHSSTIEEIYVHSLGKANNLIGWFNVNPFMKRFEAAPNALDHVINLASLFYDNASLSTVIFNSELPNLIDGNRLFRGCISLELAHFPLMPKLEQGTKMFENAKLTSNIHCVFNNMLSCNDMFASAVLDVDVLHLEIPKSIEAGTMFAHATIGELTYIAPKSTRTWSMFYDATIGVIHEFNIENVENAEGLFSNLNTLIKINKLKATSLTISKSMFKNTGALVCCSGDIDTRNATDTSEMFDGTALTQPNVSEQAALITGGTWNNQNACINLLYNMIDLDNFNMLDLDDHQMTSKT